MWNLKKSQYLFQWKKTECQQLLLFCHASCDIWQFLKARNFLSMPLAENLDKYLFLEKFLTLMYLQGEAYKILTSRKSVADGMKKKGVHVC